MGGSGFFGSMALCAYHLCDVSFAVGVSVDFTAIERAYTRALRADAGYAGLVQHNPFSASYETFSGRDEPYSLPEPAAFVELPPLAAPERRDSQRRSHCRDVRPTALLGSCALQRHGSVSFCDGSRDATSAAYMFGRSSSRVLRSKA